MINGNVIAVGGGGTGSDDCTATKANVLAGKTAVTSDSGDEAAAGTLSKDNVLSAAGGNIPTKTDSGNVNLTVPNAEKSYPAGYYPNAHGAKVVMTSHSDSGNTTLNASTTSKSYAAGYYPNAHGAQVTLADW